MIELCLQRESNTAPCGCCCKKKASFVHCPTVLCQVLWGVQMQLSFPRLCLKIYPLLLSFLWEQPKLNWSWRNYPLKEQKQVSSSTHQPLHTYPLPVHFILSLPVPAPKSKYHTCLETPQLDTSFLSRVSGKKIIFLTPKHHCSSVSPRGNCQAKQHSPNNCHSPCRTHSSGIHCQSIQHETWLKQSAPAFHLQAPAIQRHLT